MARPRTDPVPRFWKLVDASGGAEACWPWTGYVQKNGYGRFTPVDGVRGLAHRYAIEYSTGATIPEGMEAAHSCHNRRCCNPAHLRVATRSENMAEMWSKWRPHGDHVCCFCGRPASHVDGKSLLPQPVKGGHSTGDEKA